VAAVVVRPLTLFCPTEAIPAVLLPLWPPLLGHVTLTLAAAWDAHGRVAPAAAWMGGVGAEATMSDGEEPEEDGADAEGSQSGSDADEAADLGGPEGNDDGGGAAVQAAIVAERETRDLSRAFVDLLVLVFCPRQHLGALRTPASSIARAVTHRAGLQTRRR
jgi:hypothetical protein